MLKRPMDDITGQARQCLRYIDKRGADGMRWWQQEYKPRLLKTWGDEHLQRVTRAMNEEKRNG